MTGPLTRLFCTSAQVVPVKQLFGINAVSLPVAVVVAVYVESALKTAVPVAVNVPFTVPPAQPITGCVWLAPGPQYAVMCQVPTMFPPQAAKAVHAAGRPPPSPPSSDPPVLLLPLHAATAPKRTTRNPSGRIRASHILQRTGPSSKCQA